eukprot:699885-Rhodomonas_salina.2
MCANVRQRRKSRAARPSSVPPYRYLLECMMLHSGYAMSGTDIVAYAAMRVLCDVRIFAPIFQPFAPIYGGSTRMYGGTAVMNGHSAAIYAAGAAIHGRSAAI